MIIECPNCGTKYNVTREAINPKGRTVRCASCHAQWHESGEKPPAVELPESFDAREAFPPQANPQEVSPESAEAVENQSFAAESQNATEEATADNAAADALVAERRGDKASRRLPAPAKTAGKAVPAAIAVLLAAVFAGILIVPLALFHHQIEAAWPASVRIFAMAHSSPTVPGLGLSFHDVHSALRTDDKGPALSIDGLIEVSDKEKKNAKIKVPAIRAVLSKDGVEVRHWVFDPGIPGVSSTEPARFSTTLDGTGVTDGNVLLTFTAADAGVTPPLQVNQP